MSVIKFGLIVIGVIIVVVGVCNRQQQSGATLGMNSAVGQVVGQNQVSTYFGAYKVAVIQFPTTDSTQVTITLEQPSSYRIGDKVTIYYDPANPERDWAIPSGLTPWQLAFTIIVGVCIVIVGLVMKSGNR
ncbi:hypothetical protein CCAX7_44730 [Capsulimonas corticalis]|uniref:DUF3592 domain-containing protein n=1 Tax=Capsulimonas corticalis TaxID=2219043 RepID=A0A402CX25_9BACT|nr:DUF3592 domain-containing protein [Capsulimonas corticalis]BDI32422.1 hypothetical protein CCAX7_44730 [Capsulimonas corticalis]